MLGEEGIYPEFLFPLLSGEEMHSSLERKISHEIISAGRSTSCEYEYADRADGTRYGKAVVSTLIAVLLVLAFVSASAPALAATTNITTYWYVQVQTSISVSFPTGLTNITFFDTTPNTVSNVTASGQTSVAAAAVITDSGDTNITSLTAGFANAWPNNFTPTGVQSIEFVGIETAYNESATASYGSAAGVLGVYWLPHNDTGTQSLIGSKLGSPGYLSAYGNAVGSWTQHIYIWAWATFNYKVYATQASDTMTITYSA